MLASSEVRPLLPASERRAGGIILLIFLLAISLPYLILPLIFPANLVWGGLLGSADDQNVHLMWARQARDGSLFFRDLFTTEGLLTGEKPLFFNVLPLAIGWISKLTTLDVVLPYHFLRVALAGWALWQFHLLSQAFTNYEEKWSRARLLSLALLAFSTGSGMLLALPGFSRFIFIDRPDINFPLMPEAFFALSAFAYPLNIASFGLLALVFRKVMENRGAGVALGAALLLSNIHTYDALPLILTLVVWLFMRLKNVKVILAAIVGATLPVIYQFVVFRGSEEFRIKALTPTLPPDIFSIVISFGALLVFAALGFRKWRELPSSSLLLIWIFATFVLVYAPVFSFARKMLEGVQLPMLLLAGVGFSEVLSNLPKPSTRKVLAGTVIFLLAISPLQFQAWAWNNAIENNGKRLGVFMPPLQLSEGDAGALKAIDRSPGQGAVLCLPYLGSYMPRSTAKFTFAGHWAETLYLEEKKLPQLKRFYSGQMSDDEAREFLRTNKIRWVVEGQYEPIVSGGNSTARRLGLKQIYNHPDEAMGPTSVYEFAG